MIHMCDPYTRSNLYTLIRNENMLRVLSAVSESIKKISNRDIFGVLVTLFYNPTQLSNEISTHKNQFFILYFVSLIVFRTHICVSSLQTHTAWHFLYRTIQTAGNIYAILLQSRGAIHAVHFTFTVLHSFILQCIFVFVEI